MTVLLDYMTELREHVERHLQERLSPREGLPDTLLEAIRYSLLAPGKRLRPLLVVMACETVADFLHVEGELSSADEPNPWPAACAVEMIHAYSLIHDDLPAMDDDDLRRGQPTCHKKFGESLAILAGDALQALAFETLAEAYPGSTGAAACLVLARASGGVGMVGGQVDDLAWESEPAEGESRTVEALEWVHRRKTGALIRASLELGALAAYESTGKVVAPEINERLIGYGRCLGLAFQIIDDLLDVEGEAERTGKRVQKDAARGKLTYPGILGIAESRQRANLLGEEARDQLGPLGLRARRLMDLVDFVLQRDR